jgi:flagellar biosynthesis/type III secretory pathway protein FliH
MHGKSDDGADVARAAITGASRLDDQTATLYTDIILLSLRASARAIIEELMANGTYEYQSDFAKRYVAQGKALGRAEGEALGRAEGEALGLARALLAMLKARRIAVPDPLRKRVLACTDVATLDAWIVQAATATAIADVIPE